MIKNKNNQEFEQSLGYTAESITELYRHFVSGQQAYVNTWYLLDAYDRGFFWEVMKKIVPGYAIKPDTNWINYVKTSITNSLYTGNYRGDVFPRTAKYKEITNKINQFIEYTWNRTGVSKYILQAGERASLLNFGAIEVGWKADIIDGADELFHGDIEIKHIDNMNLKLDPSCKDPYKGRAMFIDEEVSLIELKNEPRFRKRIAEYLQTIEAEKDPSTEFTRSIAPSGSTAIEGYYGQRKKDSKDESVKLITCYIKYQPSSDEGYRIDRVWLIDDGYILDIQKDLRPKTFPIRILYATPPVADPYGTPVTKLVLYNCMTLNILECIEATHTYASHKRPKVVSRKAGINEKNFAREGNNPDKVWVVDGDPNSLVRYVDLPELPRDRELLKQRLEYGIMRVTGVDDRYTGRDTGSVQTTGGMDLMNQRISMSDNIRINLLQDFIKDLTELILSLYIEYGGPDRQFPIYKKSGVIDSLQIINFDMIRDNNIHFDIMVNVTPHLPNNIMRRAQAADLIMEKQMQYNMQPAIMTPEEWVESQDFPQKYHILERMAAERMRNDREEVMSDIVNYSGMINKGMRPEAAIDQLAQERQLKREQPGIGNVAGGSIQSKQM